MSNGIIMRDSIVSVKKETTENEYIAPASATDYFQPTEKGFSLEGDIAFEERDILTSGLTKPQPLRGMRSVKGKMPVEFRGSGTEGTVPQWGVLLESLFGTVHAVASRITSKNTAGTSSTAPIEDADIASFKVGDVFVVLEDNNHQMKVVTAVDSTPGSAVVSFSPVYRDDNGDPANLPASSVLSVGSTYGPANKNHPSFSTTIFYANAIKQIGTGCRSKGMTLADWKTGKVASLDFDIEGIGFDRSVGSAAHTPSYDQALPPVILNAHIFKNGVEVFADNVSLKFDNALGWMTSTAFEGGRFKGRVSDFRKISGSFAPYMDDANVDIFEEFVNGQNFAMFLTAHVYDPNNEGQFVMGSSIGIWLPQLTITKQPAGEQEGVMVDTIDFEAHGGPQGTSSEIFMGFV